MTDIRETIERELNRRKKTVYWLAKQPGAPSINTIYRFLNAGRGISVDNLESLLDVLGLRIKRRRS